MILAAAFALHLLPRPQSIAPLACSHPIDIAHALRVPKQFDDGALDEIDERWRALGLPAAVRGEPADITVVRDASPAQGYTLRVSDRRITISASRSDGIFYAAVTLAQLARNRGGRLTLPCVNITDAPALRWRILSDDVSRGPLPTMRYFEERIRTIAAFKMNGYSPYMEHVFAAPGDELPAPLDGITPAQLRELSQYAARFHVTLIPEQQSFAHMHNALRFEQYAAAAETPHAFLLSPASALSLDYEKRLIDAELRVIPHPPFFHIGSDETAALGQGQSKPLVAQMGLTQLYAQHIREMDAIVRPSGARIMLWDDGVENDPKIMALIPRNAVLVNWHYGVEKSYERYIDLLARGGFEQMVGPGASNWNSVYPDINSAIANENTFITQGKAAHVLGLFQTVWNDDGETLFEATWYPVLYAAASAWESGSVDPARYQADFPFAFFGADDARYGDDFAALATVQSAMAQTYGYTSNYLFWADPFSDLFDEHMKTLDVRALRLRAESVEQHLLEAGAPPLHANAARVMFLAARKYDFIGRKYQAAQEIRDDYYNHAPVLRGLVWTKYWFWEMRDAYAEIEPLYERAWRYEDRESHLQSNLERYHVAAAREIERADRANDAMLRFSSKTPLPPLEDILRP